MNFKVYLTAAAVALAPVAASAASVDINVQSFGDFGNLSNASNDPNIADALAARDAFIGGATIYATEDFEDFTACDGSNGNSCDSTASGGLDTDVGDFNKNGSPGGGDSPVAPEDEAVIRNAGDGDNMYGRYNVAADSDNNHEGGNWLDSNDYQTIDWTIPGDSDLTSFGRIAFFLTDVNDTGNVEFNIFANDTEIGNVTETISGGATNGMLNLVTMQFSESVSDVLISMTNKNPDVNDGFGIDTITVAAVPLPAGGLLLLSALGGVAALRRRRKAA